MEKQTIGPGIYSDMSNEDYHNSVGISKSGLVKIIQSPAHYWASYIDPEREPRIETKAFKIGSAGHKIILEPNEFLTEYKVLPKNIDDLHGATKVKKEYIKLLNDKGITDLKISEFKSISKMAKVVFDHEEAGPMLSGGAAEQSLYWIDPDTGMLCKCRPDYYIEKIAIPDYKTTIDARPDKFAKSCAEYTYNIQAAFYSDGVQALTGEVLEMPFIAQEKESPYALNVFFIDPSDVAVGRDKYKRALEVYARCVETDSWPSYPTQVRTISLPAWANKK